MHQHEGIMKSHDSTTEQHIFDDLTKGELVAALSFMHRILDVDKRRDLERLMTQLPKLFARCSGRPRTTDARERGGFLGACPSAGERPYHLLNYFSACLAKAQARMDRAQPGGTRVTQESCHLSPRELTVLLWMKEGKTNWEIARILNLSERTVRFHVGSIFEKLDVTSRTQAVARALGTGLIAS
jgi:DNA-binding CsgD family transcriptional regulator